MSAHAFARSFDGSPGGILAEERLGNDMETRNASELFAALGHESRLAVFRILVEAGGAGISAGAIGEKAGIAPPTLSFHLAHLSRVGLIKGRQDGRFIYYSADFPLMDDLLSFMVRNCCQGEPCLPKTTATNGACCPPPQAPSGSTRGLVEIQEP